mgnify:CR=1 FL=1
MSEEMYEVFAEAVDTGFRSKPLCRSTEENVKDYLAGYNAGQAWDEKTQFSLKEAWAFVGNLHERHSMVYLSGMLKGLDHIQGTKLVVEKAGDK